TRPPAPVAPLVVRCERPASDAENSWNLPHRLGKVKSRNPVARSKPHSGARSADQSNKNLSLLLRPEAKAHTASPPWRSTQDSSALITKLVANESSFGHVLVHHRHAVVGPRRSLARFLIVMHL